MLTWAVDIRTTFGACVAPRVFVDATTGAVLRMRETASFVMDRAGGVRFHSLNEASDIKTIDVTATTDLFGNNIWRMVSSGPSPKVQTFAYSPDIINRFTNAFTSPVETYLLGNWDIVSPYRGAAVDGHYYGGKALEYFKAAHNRNGLDGKGADLTVVVHDPERRSALDAASGSRSTAVSSSSGNPRSEAHSADRAVAIGIEPDGRCSVGWSSSSS